VIVGLLATAGLGYAASVTSPPVYAARGLILLLPPEDAVGEGGNPLLSMGGLGLPASILVAYFSSSAVQAEVEAVAPDASYEVSIEESTRGPLLAIDTSDSTGEGALLTLQFLAGEIPATLAQLQDEVDAPLKSAVVSMPLTMDTGAEQDRSETDRLLIVAIGVGLVGTVFAAFTLDRVLLGKRARSELRRAVLTRDRVAGVSGESARHAAETVPSDPKWP